MGHKRDAQRETGADQIKELFRLVLKIIQKDVSDERKAIEFMALLTRRELPLDTLENDRTRQMSLKRRAERSFILDKYFDRAVEENDSPYTPDSGFESNPPTTQFQAGQHIGLRPPDVTLPPIHNVSRAVWYQPLPAYARTPPGDRLQRAGRAPTTSELDNQWSTNLRPDAQNKSPGQSPEGSKAQPSLASAAATRGKNATCEPITKVPRSSDAMPSHVDIASEEGGANRNQDGAQDLPVQEMSPDATNSSSTLDEDTDFSEQTAGYSSVIELVLGCRAQRMFAKLQAHFEQILESHFRVSKLTSDQRTRNGGKPPAPYKQSQLTYAQNYDSTRPKRSRQTDDQDNEEDQTREDRDGPGDPDPKRQKTGTSSGLKIACPFMKRYPSRFSSWRTCVGPGFDGFNRMKEHLKRRHHKERSCGRCLTQFETSRLLEEHVLQVEPCAVIDRPISSGFMSQLKWNEINEKKGTGKTNVLERWRHVYLTLFPDADENAIPGPYFMETEVTDALHRDIDPNELENHIKQALPGRVLVRLNEEFSFMAQKAKERLLDIIQEESSEILKLYLQGKGVAIANPSAHSAPLQHGSQDLRQPDTEFGATWPYRSTTQEGQVDFQSGLTSDPSSSWAHTDFLQNFSWLDDDKDIEDSAYGSNMMDMDGFTFGA
ncbi:hypothetical protein GGR57DRAFT_506673 [Xylariaceae sp. FL1272]|nr:hypothetical protein GGR57DRAFT_506673 [Xylariaceae sp. FL1272]